MIIARTVRNRRNSVDRLPKVVERRVVRMYMKMVEESLLKGYRFDFPNSFGSMAVIQREKSMNGRKGLKKKMFEEVKLLEYKGAITEGAIKFIPSQDFLTKIRRQNITYRSELI